jgi:hypothetical protein
MFKQEDVVIEKQYQYVYCARVPGLDINGYGFSEGQAVAALTKTYNARFESLNEGNKVIPAANPSL